MQKLGSPGYITDSDRVDFKVGILYKQFKTPDYCALRVRYKVMRISQFWNLSSKFFRNEYLRSLQRLSLF